MRSGRADANVPALSPVESLASQPSAVELQRSNALFSLVLSTSSDKVPTTSLQEFFVARKVGESLRLWFGNSLPPDKDQIGRQLARHISEIDELINNQLNAILHHPRFQRLEAAWRGIMYLVNQAEAEGEAAVKIRVLDVSWTELERDFERSTEFDQSQLFRKIYDQEFGTPGGEPYGALIGDYELHPRPSSTHPHDDVGILQSISQVAAAAFCPFITGVSPAMFGLDSFSTLEQRLNHAKTLEQTEYLKWRAFRDTEDARFVGLALPRVLMREPYTDDGTRIDGFTFREQVAGPDHSKYLWGNAAFAFGAVLIRAFSRGGWFADIRGVQRGIDGGGLVTGLPVHSFGTDRRGVAMKSSTDVTVTDELEKELADLGFIPLCDCKDTEYSAFYSNQSAQKPKRYDRPAATTNAKISTMLQYMMCVSRFAHYLKVLGRDKTGSFAEAAELEAELQRWIVKYVAADSHASPEVKARYPLRAAQVSVRSQPGKPGSFQCVMQLAPHYELDELAASVRLATQLAPARNT